ncbi:hypothetical protein [Streptomyces chilikensis]|uniref:Uncharacterized protein n=1 Tax=Streptomyces chilikensis TaxID=1194079 RepID=A0ABV3ERQ3_9ACTN
MTTVAFPDDGDVPENVRAAQDSLWDMQESLRTSMANLMRPQQEAARMVRESLVPALDTFRLITEQLAPVRAAQESMRTALQDIAAAQRIAASPLEGVFAQIRENQEQYRRLTESMRPVIDRPLLDGLLAQTAAWQGLPAPARSAVADVLDDARAAVDAGEAQDIPEEVIAELEEQAAEFAAGVRGPLPPAAQKFLFALSMATLALSLPIYVSVTSDAGNKLLDEVTQFWPLAVLVFAAAYKGWDRMQEHHTHQEPDQDDQAE